MAAALLILDIVWKLYIDIKNYGAAFSLQGKPRFLN